MTNSARAARESSAKSAHRARVSSIPFDATVLPESDGDVKPTSDDWLGKTVGGRYRVNKLLGEGGMGRVYSAEHVHMRKTVALKLLHREMTFIPEAVARFEREAVAAARIAHPHVATALDFGRAEPNGQFYLALEFVEGRSLRTVLDEEGHLSVSRVVEIVRQVAEALQAAHVQGVVHRDLKPDNIMLVSGEADSIKVLDFGIAKVSSDNSSSTQQLTRIGAIFGTPEYMSPEQAAGRPVDHKSDLYALGVILYEMLIGTPPFVAGSMVEVLTCHLHQEPEALPAFVPTAIADLTLALLAKDPQERPESAADVVRALRIARLSALPQAPNPGPALVIRKAGIAVMIGTVRAWHRGLVWAERAKRLASPYLDRAWQQLMRRAPALAVLERRIWIGSRTVSVGAIGACGVVVVLTLIALVSKPSQSSDSVTARGLGDAPVATDAENGEEGEPVLRPNEAALQELLLIPVYKRTREQWVTLGSMYEERRDWKESIFAYRNALQLAPELRSDGKLLQRLRVLGEQPEVYESVLNVALNLLGTAGMDLIYDLWLSTRNDESKEPIAEAAIKSLTIHRLSAASPPLRALLELQFMGGACDKTPRMIKDAHKQADERIVPLLQAQKKQSCGKPGQEACLPCLQRPSVKLQPVIAAAATRKAPRFTGATYVPAQRK